MERQVFLISLNSDLCGLGLYKIIMDYNTSSDVFFEHDNSHVKDYLIKYSNVVLILDLDEADVLQLEELKQFSHEFPAAKWLFIASEPDDNTLNYLFSSFDKANFALKTNSYDVLLTAIKCTATQLKYYCSEGLQFAISGVNKKNELKKNSEFKLTQTEISLVQQIAMGKTTKEIAQIRCLSLHTVNTHRKNIFRKLQVSSVQELIRFVLKHKLVDLTEYYI